jgi:twitching motility protein PilT
MAWTLDKILRGARRFGASDIHLVHGVAPVYRINGEIRPTEGEPLDMAMLWKLVEEALNPAQREAFQRDLYLCFSRYWEGVGRCRASLYFHAGHPEMSIRLCEIAIRSATDLGLPPVVEELTRLPSGLVLVTGPTGVGKTTTLNMMIETINRERRAKIITIEDPVEYVHENCRSIVVQQEVLTDVPSFSVALLNALRQDPDVIVIGEMRNLETIETALLAAETGHLVFATLHTPDSVLTVQRIQSVFPVSQKNFISEQLANSLQAIISQKLLPRADGKGRVVACEVCIATHAVRNKIRERQAHQLYSEMQSGRKHQMQTMDHSLLTLYQQGLITYDVAVSNAREPDTIRHYVGQKSD